MKILWMKFETVSLPISGFLISRILTGEYSKSEYKNNVILNCDFELHIPKELILSQWIIKKVDFLTLQSQTWLSNSKNPMVGFLNSVPSELQRLTRQNITPLLRYYIKLDIFSRYLEPVLNSMQNTDTSVKIYEMNIQLENTSLLYALYTVYSQTVNHQTMNCQTLNY